MVELTRPQRNRLEELAAIADGRRHWSLRYAGFQKVTTAKLADAGLVEIRHRKIAKTGRIMSLGDAHITDAGRRALSSDARDGQGEG